MTTVYLIRHSKAEKVIGDSNVPLQIRNENCRLTIDGEKIAQDKFSNQEFSNIDVLFSSNYVRAMETAKYLEEKNNIKMNILSDLGERKQGISSWSELPKDFEIKQFLDENYKIGNGENQKEVRERMYSTVMNIVDQNKNKRIAIVSHATAISFLLKKWCDIRLGDNKLIYSYNGKILLEGYFNYCETFKIDFDDSNNVVNIENIK